MEKQTRKPDISSKPGVSGPLSPDLDGRGVALPHGLHIRRALRLDIDFESLQGIDAIVE